MSGTTTVQHAVTPSDEVKAIDRLVGQMADLSRRVKPTYQ
jgi:hypothetical protein